MRFLTLLFWIIIAVFAAILASQNWHDVTIDLWNDLQADIKLPVLLLLMFLIGFLPPWLILRGRIWHLRRRQEALERQQHAAQPADQPDEDEVAAE